jgi:hypothetical protein
VGVVATVMRGLAFTLTVLLGVLGTLFVAGEALADPGGLAGGLLTALWVLPMVALSVLARRRPSTASRVLTLVTWTVAGFTVVDSLVGAVPADGWGPVTAVLTLAVGVALGFLGLHRPGRAGRLLLVLAGTLLVATVGNMVMHQTGLLPPGPGLGASSGVVALPLLVVGGLFLLAEPSPDRTPVGAPHRVSESPTAADRPASSRATGTRNGEQDT